MGLAQQPLLEASFVVAEAGHFSGSEVRAAICSTLKSWGPGTVTSRSCLRDSATDIVRRHVLRGDGFMLGSQRPDARSLDADAVIAQEWREYISSRRGVSREVDPSADVVGVALSGGGIRSAAFCFGAMEALIEQGLYNRVDYLSSVSGGGFAAAALINQHRHELNAAKTDRSHMRARLVDHLRMHASYLAPGGIWGFDGLKLTLTYATGLTFSLASASLTLLAVTTVYVALSIALPGATTFLEASAVIASFFGTGILLARSGPSPRRDGTVRERERSALVLCAATGAIGFALWQLDSFTSAVLAIYRIQLGQHAFGDSSSWWSDLVFAREGLARLASWRLPAYVTAVCGGCVVLGLLLRSLSVSIGLSRPSLRVIFKLPIPALGVLAAATAVKIAVAGLARVSDATGLPLRSVITFAPAGLTAVAIVVAWLRARAAAGLGSIHHFYRDQITNAFIVETTPTKPPRPEHDVPLASMADLSSKPPYALINTTANLRNGIDLFLLTPLFCGSDATGYCRTAEYGDCRLALNTAVAVSGAAVSPLMGRFSDPLLSPLMGLFNLRLGVFFPNPTRPPPRVSPGSYWNDLRLGWLSSKSSYCYLTDGGHFDNLGLALKGHS